MEEGSVCMYCPNCGNKVFENAYVCVNCGTILNKEGKTKRVRKKSSVPGILSIFFGILAFVLSIGLFFIDISFIGMYNELEERVFYAIGYVIIPFIFTMLSLIFALIGTSKTSNKVGLWLSLSALFLVITEVVVILVY